MFVLNLTDGEKKKKSHGCSFVTVLCDLWHLRITWETVWRALRSRSAAVWNTAAVAADGNIQRLLLQTLITKDESQTCRASPSRPEEED